MRTRENSADAIPSTGPLLLWLGIQLGVVALAAARVPLAAQYVEPAEYLAPHLLLGTQVVAAALLFPFLFRDFRSAVQVVATAIPFQLAAAFLAGLGANVAIQPAGFVELWLLTLAVWTKLLRSPYGQMLAVAVTSCLTLGGATLRYLRLEFGQVPPAEPTFESASPLLTTLAAVEGSPTFTGWALVLSLMGVGLAALTISRFRIHRKLIPPTNA